jgi:uncharacterized membrane protein
MVDFSLAEIAAIEECFPSKSVNHLRLVITTRSTIGWNILFNLYLDNIERKGTVSQKIRHFCGEFKLEFEV